jgi:hypothetical protein
MFTPLEAQLFLAIVLMAAMTAVLLVLHQP